jgi:hypothetical protein
MRVFVIWEKEFIIRCFASYFSWCNNLSCQMLIGGQQGGGFTTSL